MKYPGNQFIELKLWYLIVYFCGLYSEFIYMYFFIDIFFLNDILGSFPGTSWSSCCFQRFSIQALQVSSFKHHAKSLFNDLNIHYAIFLSKLLNRHYFSRNSLLSYAIFGCHSAKNIFLISTPFYLFVSYSHIPWILPFFYQKDLN